MGRGNKLAMVTAPVVVAMGMLSLSACGVLARSTFEDDTVLEEEITSVRLDSSNGRLTLRGDDTAAEVSIHRRVEYRRNRPEDPTHRVEDGVLVLEGCGRSCSVDYTVDLPAGLPVTGETSNGAISLSGVGDVDVRTDNGAVTLEEVTGTVTVRSSNGKIEGRGLGGGPIEARTDNGAIDLTLATPQDVQAETSNGAITITVPDGSYQVSAETGNGSTNIGVADDPAGEHLLELTTDNGSITVNSA
jgi:hypothetical protein